MNRCLKLKDGNVFFFDWWDNFNSLILKIEKAFIRVLLNNSSNYTGLGDLFNSKILSNLILNNPFICSLL
jgi:hypothetical protein